MGGGGEGRDCAYSIAFLFNRRKLNETFPLILSPKYCTDIMLNYSVLNIKKLWVTAEISYDFPYSM
jgi:hypothetical protein